MKSSNWAVHPVVLAATFVLQAALSNGLAPVAFARPMLVAVAAAAFVLGILWIVVRDARIAGLFATGFLLLIISHDPVIHVLGAASEAFGTIGTIVGVALTLFVPITAMVIAVDQLRRGHLDPRMTRPATSALNIFSLVLLAVVVLPAVPSIPSWFRAHDRAPVQLAGDPPPDVYVFLLDGYSRADELERQFGIDNEFFLQELRARGFDVDERSRSNYSYTSLTLTSLLSMDYVVDAVPGPLAESRLTRQLREAMASGAGPVAIRAAGYEIVATAAGWEGTSLRPLADRFLDRPELTDFERALLARTWIPDVPPVPQDLFFDHLRARIDGILDDAVGLSDESGDAPVFALIHVPAPHLPIAFTADGGPTTYDSRQYLAGRPSEFGHTSEEFASAYAGSLSYLNRRVLETVDALQASNDPPVIILMSDHGYNGDSPVHTAAMLHNLFAASMPGESGLLAPSPTPVNLIRAILGAYTNVPAGPPREERFFTTHIAGSVGSYDLALTEVTDP